MSHDDFDEFLEGFGDSGIVSLVWDGVVELRMADQKSKKQGEWSVKFKRIDEDPANFQSANDKQGKLF